MPNELLKDALRLKLKASGMVINMLPEAMQNFIKPIHNEVLKNIHDITGEFLKDDVNVKSKKTLQSVEIE